MLSKKDKADAREAERKAKADAKEAERIAKIEAKEAERIAKEAERIAKIDAKLAEELANKYIGYPLDIVTDNVKQQFAQITMFAKQVAMGLGKGRSEVVYQNALCQELQLHGINYQAEETLSIKYKNIIVGQERLDIHIYGPGDPMILELKATSSDIKPDEQWQVISYMRITGCKFGAVINFNQSLTKKLQIEYIVLCNDKAYSYDIITGLTIGEPMNDY